MFAAPLTVLQIIIATAGAGSLDQRFNDLDQRLDTVQHNLDHADHTLDEINRRLDALDFDRGLRAIDAINQRQQQLQSQQEQLYRELQHSPVPER